MSDQATNAIVATVLGTVVAIVLLIPTAAYQYRRDGRLGPGDLSILLSGAVYGLALWTYTLLPMPAEDDYACQGRQLEPFGSVRLILTDQHTGAVGLLRDPAFLQVALNVLLFVPLGYYIRVVLHRGVVVAGVVGLSLSLLVELTQLTGVWGIYDCAYRLFDVDDLAVNTLGALGGSLVSAVLVGRPPRVERLPQTLSFGRRLVGMVCDVVFVVLVGAVVAIGYRAWYLYGPPALPGTGDRDVDLQTALQLGVPFVLEAASVLVLGKTVGEWVADLRTVRRRRGPLVVARLVKLALGVSPLFVLALLGGPWVYAGVPAYLVVTLVAAWRTPGHRGLSNGVAGLGLEIDVERDVTSAAAGPPRPNP